MKISFLMPDKLLWIIALWSFFVIGSSYPHLPKCNAFCLYQLIWGQLLQNVLLPSMQCFLLWSNVALSLPNSITPPPPAPSCYPSQWGQLVRGMLHQCYVFLFLFFFFSFVFCLSFVSSHPGRLSKNCSIVEWGPLPPTTSSHHSTSPDLQRPTAGSPFSPALSLTLPSHSPSPSPSSAGDVSSCDSPLQLLRHNSDFPIPMFTVLTSDT